MNRDFALPPIALAMTEQGPPAAEYARADIPLAMTLKHLKWVAIVTPVVLVGLLEWIRHLSVIQVSLSQRLLLDGIVAGVLIVFGVTMIRAIDGMHGRLKRYNRELLALHGAGLDVSAELSLDVVLKKVVDQARHLVGAKYGALSVIGSSGHIDAFITSGITPEERALIGPPPVGHGLLRVVLQDGQTLRLPDLNKDPRSVGFPPNHPPMRSLLAVPIPCKGPFLGNLYLADKEGSREFSIEDEETLKRFAVPTAIAIDNAHLHRQVADLATAQERIRIAHEMHDGIAQVLGYVNTKVQAANEYIRRGKTDEATTQLRELAVAAREAYTDVREAIVDLRTLPTPLRSFGDVLEEYVERWKEQTGISTQLTIGTDLLLTAGVELQLIRIVQESLSNVRKHARAASVKIKIRRVDDRLQMIIVDDGIGFTPGALARSEFPRFGLSTMKERAESIGGTLLIEAGQGKGTAVKVTFPA